MIGIKLYVVNEFAGISGIEVLTWCPKPKTSESQFVDKRKLFLEERGMLRKEDNQEQRKSENEEKE